MAAVYSTGASSLTSGLRTRTPHQGDREAVEQVFGHRGSERLDEVEPPAVTDGADAIDDLRVVDRVGELVGAHAGVVNDERHVEHELLTGRPLLLERAVKPAQIEPLDFDHDLTHGPPARERVERGRTERRSCVGSREGARDLEALNVLAHVVGAEERRSALVREHRHGHARRHRARERVGVAEQAAEEALA